MILTVIFSLQTSQKGNGTTINRMEIHQSIVRIIKSLKLQLSCTGMMEIKLLKTSIEKKVIDRH